MAKVADISDELIKIRGEDKGEIVRDSIISAFNKLNATPSSANSVNGYTVNDLVLKSTVNNIFPIETELKENSSRAVTSGGIYNYLGKVDEVLDGITGSTSGIPYDPTSIKYKLSNLKETKKQIRAAIIAKQVEVDKDASFRSYAEKVKAIPTVAEIQTSEVTISANDEYDAGKGKAYSVVTAEVKPNTTKKTVNKVGKYKAEDDGYEAYSEVEVEISSGLKTKSITASDLSSDSYETSIKVSDEKDKDAIGYSEVSIDVSGKFAELKEEIDPNGGTESFEFDAKDEDLYGYSKITLTMLEITGPFTVEFYDGENKLYTDSDVPKNGTCHYKGSVPMEKDGYIFKGWNPKPVNVTKNMKVYAQWEKKKGDPEPWSSRSWNSIVANGGADAVAASDTEAGTEKEIFWYGFRSSYTGSTAFGPGSAIARCVAKGEDGTGSTWVMSINLGYLASESADGLKYGSKFPGSNGLFQGSAKELSYDQSNVAKFFDTDFVQAIRSYPGQEDLSFQNVNKYTLVCDENGCQIEKLINCSGLWLLSAQEMGGSGENHGFRGITGMSRSMGGMSIGRQAISNVSFSGEITSSGAGFIGQDMGYKCPAHLWWSEKVYRYCESHNWWPVNSIWPAIRDKDKAGGFERGYLGVVNVGFCL